MALNWMMTMPVRMVSIAAAAVCLMAGGLAAQETSTPADTVILHAKVYTVSAQRPSAEAVAIRGEKILAVGSEKQIAAYRGASTNVIDAKGRMLLPGLTDTHTHFTEASFRLQQVSLDDAKTLAEYQARIKDYADAHPTAPWILGGGWTYPVFGATGLPDKKYIDQVVSDRPVFLIDYNGHTFWANGRALQMAGITRDTPNPPNGEIVREQKTGEPTGALKETAAGDLVGHLIPKPTREETLEALRRGIQYANSLGLVRVHSAGGDTASLELLSQLRRQNQLSLRFYVANFIDPPELTSAAVDAMEQARQIYHDEWLDAGTCKFMLDGLIETHTATMLAPYANDPSSGPINWDPVKYKQAVLEVDRRGFQIFTHAIGDRAIRIALDVFQQMREANRHLDARDRLEHIEDPSVDEIPRFGNLGVIASMQPLHAYPNDSMLHVWSANVGPERAKQAFPWHSILSGGGHLSFGSDWPVVTLNPWPALQFLLTRETTEGAPAGGWHPEERLSLAQAIDGYTLGGAFAGRRERTEGTLEAGKWADMILVSQDLFQADRQQIGQTKVLMTMVAGRVVYQSQLW
jgi:hypothetical protein